MALWSVIHGIFVALAVATVVFKPISQPVEEDFVSCYTVHDYEMEFSDEDERRGACFGSCRWPGGGVGVAQITKHVGNVNEQIAKAHAETAKSIDQKK
ncbi:hypothetical protein TorRG33x02_062850 [Trema orientale]|uniref:Transmembrane protein n=1 Tax=Trema orientale TaxID=63057 RepID=A0A2P5FJJ6_TREOI|nr:hypothetical protein TorRG33x02_062850 [Trema orientale]